MVWKIIKELFKVIFFLFLYFSGLTTSLILTLAAEDALCSYYNFSMFIELMFTVGVFFLCRGLYMIVLDKIMDDWFGEDK